MFIAGYVGWRVKMDIELFSRAVLTGGRMWQFFQGSINSHYNVENPIFNYDMSIALTLQRGDWLSPRIRLMSQQRGH